MAVAAGLNSAQAEGGQVTCHRRVVAKGFPNKIETVASLSAMRIWSETAKDRHGSDYAMWHNAGGRSLRCSAVQNSKYIMCVAIGRPCKMHAANVKADKTAQRVQ
jgi:hypothetical protein